MIANSDHTTRKPKRRLDLFEPTFNGVTSLRVAQLKPWAASSRQRGARWSNNRGRFAIHPEAIAIPMITLEKLGTYQEFNGDVDGWVRASKGRGESSMTDADWRLIDELLMGLATIGSGVASSSLAREVEARVRACTVDEATRAALRTLAARQGPNNAD